MYKRYGFANIPALARFVYTLNLDPIDSICLRLLHTTPSIEMLLATQNFLTERIEQAFYIILYVFVPLTAKYAHAG